MRFILTFFLILVLLTPSAQARDAWLHIGPPVPIYKSERHMKYAIRQGLWKKGLNDPTYRATIRAIVPGGTRCEVLTPKFGATEIRILEGPFKGVIGWTSSVHQY